MEPSSKIQSYSALETLLEAEVTPYLKDSIENFGIVEDFLEKNQELFFEKIGSLNLNFETKELVQKKLFEKMLEVEDGLKKIFATNDISKEKDLLSVLKFVYKKISPELLEGKYLSEKGAEQIFKALPPKNLKKLFFDTQQKFSYREMIAISRQSESSQWKTKYKDILKKVDDNLFERGQIKITVLTTEEFKKLTHLENKTKPWNMTHSKEAGVIFCTVPNKKTDLLLSQYILLLLHYLYETSAAGNHLNRFCKEGCGEHISKIINTSGEKLPCFGANVYSESIFWKLALNRFQSLFPQINFSFFADTFDCGGKIQDGTLVSLNFIDLIWSMNFPKSSSTKKYFEIEKEIFTYHFQEALWLNLCLLLAEKEYTDILNFLDIGDVTLTKELL